MRRKTLYNNLTETPDLRSVLLKMGLPETVRGEALTPEQLLELYRRLNA
jgi:16S rRNA A1518/A1519 N6-dimethyltransferase RsmA/KsgA/DIM1 with predicted DNA glycosylase/AP lyase activity